MVRLILVVLVGASLGGLIGRTRSCTDGGCPLTANPTRGAMWGGFLGLMVALSLGYGRAPGGVTARTADLIEQGVLVEIASEDEFERLVLGAEGQAVVYFHADWCPPCKRYGPVFADVAEANAEKALFARVDFSSRRELADRYGVEAIPATLIFEGGELAGRLVGAVSREELSKAVESAGSGGG